MVSHLDHGGVTGPTHNVRVRVTAAAGAQKCDGAAALARRAAASGAAGEPESLPSPATEGH